MSDIQTNTVQTNIVGSAGHIQLNRPKALNAMTIDMVTKMTEALRSWVNDDSVHHVIITSSQSRAFCAGGDVRQAVSVIDENPQEGATPYFKAEYGLDMCLASFPKPITSLVRGVVMGGGLGVARLSDYLVISSDIKMAMPETAIGLFPDVGASVFLRRAPLACALMMGMTGTIIGAGDALAWNLADIHCDEDDFDKLFNALSSCQSDQEIREILTQFQKPAPPAKFASQEAQIADIFLQETLHDIVASAKAHKQAGGYGDWFDHLDHKCPISIACFWHMMTKEPVPQTMIEAIDRDYHLARKLTARPDFREGVRAVLVDKDNQPSWHPATLGDVTDDMLAALFDFDAMSPLPERGFTPKKL